MIRYVDGLERAGADLVLDLTITPAEARTATEALRRRGRRATVLAAGSVIIDATSTGR